MENIVNKFIEKSRPVYLVLAMIVVWGSIAYITIPKEDKPDIQIPFIGINLSLRGISAEDAERLMVKPMEKELKSISGLKKMTSYSFFGGSSINLEFPAGFDGKKALQDVRDKVNQEKSSLPSEADDPTIYELNFSEFPVLTVLLTGNIPEKTLITVAKNLKEKVTQLKSVLKVKVVGDRKEIVEVVIDPLNINSYGLTTDQVYKILSSNNQLVAAGKLEDANGSYTIKIPSTIESIEDIMNFPIKVSGDTVVKIKDVADIRQTFRDSTNLVRANGKQAISLEISKNTGANIIDTIAKIKEVVDREQNYWPQNLKVIYASDTSESIVESLDDLENNIVFAAILALIPIVMSIGLRSAFLVTFSVPGSFLIGILFIKMLGYSLNIVVIFSLILSIGMLVDAAIVVCEYADRKMLEGVSHKKAYSMAAGRMLWPIMGAASTALVVFVPLFFWPGMIGEFMKYMPTTIIATVGGSLLMAFIFIPVLGSSLGRPEKLDKATIKSILASESSGDINDLQGLTKLYAKSLNRVLNYPILFPVATLGVLVIVSTIFVSWGPGLEFFPKIEPKTAKIKVFSRGNFSLLEKDEVMKRVENKLKKVKKEIDVVYTTSGKPERSTSADQIGEISLEFTNWKKRRKSTMTLGQIRKDLKDLYGVKIEVVEQNEGPRSGKPINVEILSRFPTKLNKATEKVIQAMIKVKGLIDIQDSRDPPAIEWELEIDREMATRHAADVSTIGNFVKLVTNGLKISSFRPDYSDEEVDIIIRFPENKRNIKQLDDLIINTPKGPIAISNFITRKPIQQIQSVKRIGGIRAISVEANLDKGALADTKMKEMSKLLKNADIDPEVQIRFAGENQDQEEASKFLLNAFLLALLGMILIMLIEFNSFYETMIIMSAVFLSTTGVLLGLLLTNQPFGIVMCGVGIIALAGTVVSNNIIFIDTYKVLIEKKTSLKDALVRTGAQRLRPILLTAGTGVLGLLPMVYGVNIDFIAREITIDAPASQWWRQLSTTIAGGLAFATILTLFFTPCLLLVGNNVKNFYNKRKKK